MKRENGFYWVRKNTEWTIAEWLNGHSSLCLVENVQTKVNLKNGCTACKYGKCINRRVFLDTTKVVFEGPSFSGTFYKTKRQ